MKLLLALVAVFVSMLPAVAQHPSDTALPVVKSAELPLYPHLARMARIEGTAHVEVTTNGDGITKVTASGAHKVLLEAAEANVRTWRFYPHKPQTFAVTYVYKLEEPEVFGWVNPTITLSLPTHVEIHTKMHTVETTVAH